MIHDVDSISEMRSVHLSNLTFQSFTAITFLIVSTPLTVMQVRVADLRLHHQLPARLDDQPHRSITFSNQKNISGEEAWVRRCFLPPVTPWPIQNVKSEVSLPQDASSMQLSSTVNAIRQGEITGMQPLNQALPLTYQPRSSEASSFLYSIPQWQAPFTQPNGQHFYTVPPQPGPAQWTIPPSARLQGLPPPPQLSSQRNRRSSTVPSGFQPTVPSNLGLDEKIPGTYKNDILDKRIGIRPRNKESIELRRIKNPRYTGGEKGIDLPHSMKIIVQQFMIANGYVYPHEHIPASERLVFRDSLLLRLDLHNTFITTHETKHEQNLIKSLWTRIDLYVMVQSGQWRAQGVFEQVSETASPAFAAFTKGWMDRNWDGSGRGFTPTVTSTTILPASPMSLDGSKRGSEPMESESFREPSSQSVVLGAEIERSMDNVFIGHEPTLKRPNQDGHDTQPSKRVCNRDDTRATNKDTNVDHVLEDADSLESTTPKEKRLPLVIEAIHRAQTTILDLAPMSAKDLALMQQAWTSHGFPTMLADTLKVGQSYTKLMGNYFDHALGMLNLLKESGHCKTDDMEIQVDCADQDKGSASEQLQNLGLRDPLVQLSREFEIQHSCGRGNAEADPSREGKECNQRIPTKDDNVDRSSQAEEGALYNQLPKEVTSDMSVPITERAKVDLLHEPTATTPEVQHDGVASPGFPIGIADDCCIL